MKFGRTFYFEVPSKIDDPDFVINQNTGRDTLKKRVIRKTFRIDAKNKQEADEILNKMAELYMKKIQGDKPIDIASKLRSVPKDVPTIDEKMLRMLKGLYK